MKKLLLLITLFLIQTSLFSQVGIFPGEELPEKVASKREVQAGPNNWGEDLLLPDALFDRVKSECVYPVVIKVFDTAENYNHPDLAAAKLTGTNYCNPKGSNVDIQGHSTHCAGIVGSRYLGLTRGLVEKGLLKIKPVKVLGDTGSGSFDWIATAIRTEDVENRALLQSGTFVVGSMSLGGGTGKVAAVETVLKASKELGVIYCAAAGNTGQLGVNYPGNSEHLMGVGSITSSLVRSSFSTFGPEVWTGMPGSGINSTYLNSGYATLSGTSMATPFQAAACAIALSKYGTQLTNLATMKQYMAWVASDIPPSGKDNETGYGYALIKSILDKNPKDMGTTPPPPPPPTDPPTPPNPPTHAIRNLHFTLDGSWQIVWGINGQVAGTKKSKVARQVVINDVDAKGYEALTITRLEIRSVQTKQWAADEFALVTKSVNGVFRSRGLMLPAGSDYADAAFWAAYFLDLIAKTEYKHEIDVIRIEAKDPKGNTVTFEGDALKRL